MSLGSGAQQGAKERADAHAPRRVLPGLFLRGQTPFVVAILCLAAVVALADTHAFESPTFVAGLALIAVATLAAAFLPWDRVAENWVIAVPTVDLLAMALVRETTRGDLPGAGAIVILPVLWLGYGFSTRGIPIAVLGTAFVTAFPFLLRGSPPASALEWGNVALLPILMLIVVISSYLAADYLRRQRRALAETSADLRRLLAESTDQSMIIRSVADAVDAGILFFDPEHRPQLRNRAVTAMFARAGYDPVTHLAPHIFGSDRRTQLAAETSLLDLLQKGEQPHGPIYWIGREGDQRAVTMTTLHVDRPSGEFLGTAVIAADVTALVNALQVREDFLTSVSHELRTPLTSIVGYVDIIADAYEDGARDFETELQVIQRNATQLLALIGDLLGAGEGSGTVATALNRAPTDLGVLLEDSVSAFRLRASDVGVGFETPICARVVASVDPTRITQVVDNLLSNAVKYTPRGGAISVDLRQDGADAEIRVANTGPGISQDDQRQLFDRFFRSQHARSEAVQGVGLGLSIVKAIVDAHEGSIRVQSAPGEGATFIVRIPLQPVGWSADPTAPLQHPTEQRVDAQVAP